MKEEIDSIPKIVGRVTIENRVYYYCDDGNIYISDYRTNKLTKIDSSKKDIINSVRNRFIRIKGSNDVIVKETDEEMDR